MNVPIFRINLACVSALLFAFAGPVAAGQSTVRSALVAAKER